AAGLGVADRRVERRKHVDDAYGPSRFGQSDGLHVDAGQGEIGGFLPGREGLALQGQGVASECRISICHGIISCLCWCKTQTAKLAVSPARSQSQRRFTRLLDW